MTSVERQELAELRREVNAWFTKLDERLRDLEIRAAGDAGEDRAVERMKVERRWRMGVMASIGGLVFGQIVTIALAVLG